MNMNRFRDASRGASWVTLTLAAVLVTTAPVAQASLTAYSPAGANLVRLQNGPLDLTLTADGNLLGNLLASASDQAALIGAIIAASGNPTLTSGDFSNDGRTSYLGAQAFISYLNTANYGGTNQWRLPGMTDTGTPGCNFSYSGTDCGYNVDPASSELARLYYSELGLIGKFDTDGFPNSGGGYGIFANDNNGNPTSGAVGLFSNLQSDAYWLGLDYSPGTAWIFATGDGIQGFESKQGLGYAWAVTSGAVSPVPLPGSVWLIGSGLLCLARLRRTRQA
jgi:hypothetical protein